MSDTASQPYSNQDLKGLSVGEILLRTRTHYGHSLDQVEQVLRIRAQLLDALEKDDISKLPGRVYAIGFIRSYAEYLGLDGDQIVNLFKQQLGKNALRPEYNFPVAVDESKRPDLTIFVISLIGLVIVFGCYTLFKPDKSPKAEKVVVAAAPVDTADEVVVEASSDTDIWPPKVEDVMPDLTVGATDLTQAAETETEEAVAEVVAAAPRNATEESTQLAPAQAASAEKAHNDTGKSIRIYAKDPTWMQIKNAEGETVFTGILKRDKDIVVPENAIGWRMDTGNAGGIEIYIGDEKLPPLGENGIVVRRVPLFAQALRDRLN